MSAKANAQAMEESEFAAARGDDARTAERQASVERRALRGLIESRAGKWLLHMVLRPAIEDESPFSGNQSDAYQRGKRDFSMRFRDMLTGAFGFGVLDEIIKGKDLDYDGE